MPECEYEDGSGYGDYPYCVWTGMVSGNGVGLSYLVVYPVTARNDADGWAEWSDDASGRDNLPLYYYFD